MYLLPKDPKLMKQFCAGSSEWFIRYSFKRTSISMLIHFDKIITDCALLWRYFMYLLPKGPKLMKQFCAGSCKWFLRYSFKLTSIGLLIHFDKITDCALLCRYFMYLLHKDPN